MRIPKLSCRNRAAGELCLALCVGFIFSFITQGCEISDAIKVECDENSDCGENQACDYGICRDTCGGVTGCDTGWTCKEDKCYKECEGDTECRQDLEVCIDNVCVGKAAPTPEPTPEPTTTPTPTPGSNDFDGDGILNSVEDKNGNGIIDDGETDPHNADSDNDGLGDGVEDANQDGERDPGETNPTKSDTDGDLLSDGIEDLNKNGQRDAGETDPLNADSDADSVMDGVEDLNKNGQHDTGEMDPLNADTDGDQILDGVEDKNQNGTRLAWEETNETDPLVKDTDEDGLEDGCEDNNHNGVWEQDLGETDPLRPDTDVDGILDGIEDKNQNCMVDPGESDPLDPDTDDDGIKDGDEDKNHDGVLDADETDPTQADSDGDGLSDWIEINGTSQTDPRDDDSDDDGVKDGDEDKNQNGKVDYGETDPKNPDSDSDGLTDGQETCTDPLKVDTDGDGLPDGTEDPDGDCIPGTCATACPIGDECTGEELCLQVTATDKICVSRACAGDQTSPILADMDGDGLSDGQEDCNKDGLYDEGTDTDPLNPDTDGDGVPDGDEDRNGDCVLGTCDTDCSSEGDPVCDAEEAECVVELGICWSYECADGETSPHTDDSDGDGIPDEDEGTNLVCSAENLKVVDFHRSWPPNFLIALETFLGDYYDELYDEDFPIGAVFYSTDHQVAGFIVTHPPAGGVTNAGDQEAYDRGIIEALIDPGTGENETTRSLVTFDGYPAVVGSYTLQGITPDIKPSKLVNDIAQALYGDSLMGLLDENLGDSASEYRFYFETAYRSSEQVVTIGALSTNTLINDEQIIKLEDVTNSTALAEAPDRINVQCDSFPSVGNNLLDFIWVVDNSGSMEEEQTAVSDAAVAMGIALGNTSLDWRIGITTTCKNYDSYTCGSDIGGGNGNLVGGDFTTDTTTFEDRVKVGAENGKPQYKERGLEMGIAAYDKAIAGGCTDPENPAADKIRCGATVIIVVLSDEDAQSLEDACGGENYDKVTCGSTYNSWINYWVGEYTSRELTLFAVVGGVPKCDVDIIYNASTAYNDVVNFIPGSSSMSICDASQQSNMETIVSAAAGVASTYILTKPPISATLKVAVQPLPSVAPVLIPRSRSNGFDYDGTKNSVVFYGESRPSEDGLDITVSYRSFEKCIPEPEICDGIDNDCNGLIDEIDEDEDTYLLCVDDCDDTDPDVHPGATEICNCIDDDCDGLIDEGFDTDNDGWTTICGQAGLCTGPNDCDDNNPTVYPGATEYCNFIDDDCDELIDEGFDEDEDGWTTCEGDCDDTDPEVYPGLEEICDCKDNDCDFLIDEGFDLDGDGWTAPCGDCNGLFDCDDNDNMVYPGAPEICDGKDNDCDGIIDPESICG